MTRNNRHRLGFTLTELLVVIAIIAVLAALASVAVFSMVGSTQQRNTESAIKTVGKILQSHWKFVIDEAKADQIAPGTHPALFTLAEQDTARAKVLWVKLRLMEAFPQSYADIGTPATPPFVYSADPSSNPYIPIDKRRYIVMYQKKLGGATGPKAGESAACLLMALSISRGGSVLDADKISFAVGDTDGDGIKELIDGWGRPMIFARFGLAPNPAAGSSAKNAKLADPVDGDGTLINNSWYNSTVVYVAPNVNARMFFEAQTKYTIAAVPPPPQTAAQSNYIIPVIASTGKNPAIPSDDIFSYNLRLD